MSSEYERMSKLYTFLGGVGLSNLVILFIRGIFCLNCNDTIDNCTWVCNNSVIINLLIILAVIDVIVVIVYLIMWFVVNKMPSLDVNDKYIIKHKHMGIIMAEVISYKFKFEKWKLSYEYIIKDLNTKKKIELTNFDLLDYVKCDTNKIGGESHEIYY